MAVVAGPGRWLGVGRASVTSAAGVWRLGLGGSACRRRGGGFRPAVPGGPSADLVFVECGEILAGLEGLLHGPAAPGHSHQGGQRHRFGCVGAVKRQLTDRAQAFASSRRRWRPRRPA